MIFFKKVYTIVCKDLTAELRAKETLLSMCLFSFLILIVFNFAFGANLNDSKDIIPGILWVAFIFAGLMGLDSSFSTERVKGTLPGLRLCPVSAWELFLAKMTATLIFTVIMEIFTLLILAILYNLKLLPVLWPLALIIFLGTLGFATTGTIFATMSSTTKAKGVILSILVFPISIPVIIASVKATAAILDGKTMSAIYSWIKILTAYDLIFLLLAYLTFEFILEE